MLNVSSFFAHFYIIKDDVEELIMKKIYEIILSKDEIEQSDWEELFMEVSKINGLMNNNFFKPQMNMVNLHMETI